MNFNKWQISAREIREIIHMVQMQAHPSTLYTNRIGKQNRNRCNNNNSFVFALVCARHEWIVGGAAVALEWIMIDMPCECVLRWRLSSVDKTSASMQHLRDFPRMSIVWYPIQSSFFLFCVCAWSLKNAISIWLVSDHLRLKYILIHLNYGEKKRTHTNERI